MPISISTNDANNNEYSPSTFKNDFVKFLIFFLNLGEKIEMKMPQEMFILILKKILKTTEK